jgi:hypothetical protein
MVKWLFGSATSDATSELPRVPIDKPTKIMAPLHAKLCKQRTVCTHAVTVASLPFRFKAGGNGNMAPMVSQQHHHRSTTKQSQKSFKSRHASKGALKELSKGISLARSLHATSDRL